MNVCVYYFNINDLMSKQTRARSGTGLFTLATMAETTEDGAIITGQKQLVELMEDLK